MEEKLKELSVSFRREKKRFVSVSIGVLIAIVFDYLIHQDADVPGDG